MCLKFDQKWPFFGIFEDLFIWDPFKIIDSTYSNKMLYIKNEAMNYFFTPQ